MFVFLKLFLFYLLERPNNINIYANKTHFYFPLVIITFFIIILNSPSTDS